jgi:hypothetical protein
MCSDYAKILPTWSPDEPTPPDLKLKAALQSNALLKGGILPNFDVDCSISTDTDDDDNHSAYDGSNVNDDNSIDSALSASVEVTHINVQSPSPSSSPSSENLLSASTPADENDDGETIRMIDSLADSPSLPSCTKITDFFNRDNSIEQTTITNRSNPNSSSAISSSSPLGFASTARSLAHSMPAPSSSDFITASQPCAASSDSSQPNAASFDFLSCDKTPIWCSSDEEFSIFLQQLAAPSKVIQFLHNTKELKALATTLLPIFTNYIFYSNQNNRLACAELLKTFLLFPKQNLKQYSKPRGGKRRGKNNTTSFFSRFNIQIQEPIGGLSMSVSPVELSSSPQGLDPSDNSPAPRSPDALPVDVAIKAKEFLSRGLVSHAAKAIIDYGKSSMADCGEREIAALRILHPSPLQDHSVAALLLPDSPFQILTSEQICDVKKRMNLGASAGPSGWSVQLLFQLMGIEDLQAGFVCIIQDIVNDQLHPRARQMILNAHLFPIKKKPVSSTAPISSDPKLRPIGVEEAIWKISNAVAFQACQAAINKIFDRFQYGLGASGGSAAAILRMLSIMHASPDEINVHFPWKCEGLHHSVQDVDEAENLPAGILVDFGNAFNARSRTDLMTRFFANKDLAPLHRMLGAILSNASPMQLRRANGMTPVTIMSEEGGKQGNTLICLAFAMANMPLNLECVAGLHTDMAAVVDDSNFVGKATSTITAYRRLEAYIDQHPKSGLTIVPGKSKFYWPHAVVPEFVKTFLQDTNMELYTDGVETLGTFISKNKQKTIDWSLNKVNSISSKFAKLPFTPELGAQASSIILRQNMVSKLGYLTQTISPPCLREAAAEFDSSIASTYAEINLIPKGCLKSISSTSSDNQTSSSLSATAIRMAAPLRHGGLGLTKVLHTLEPAYLSSWLRAINLYKQSTNTVSSDATHAPIPNPSPSNGLPSPVTRGEKTVIQTNSDCGFFAVLNALKEIDIDPPSYLLNFPQADKGKMSSNTLQELLDHLPANVRSRLMIIENMDISEEDDMVLLKSQIQEMFCSGQSKWFRQSVAVIVNQSTQRDAPLPSNDNDLPRLTHWVSFAIHPCPTIADRAANGGFSTKVVILDSLFDNQIQPPLLPMAHFIAKATDLIADHRPDDIDESSVSDSSNSIHSVIEIPDSPSVQGNDSEDDSWIHDEFQDDSFNISHILNQSNPETSFNDSRDSNISVRDVHSHSNVSNSNDQDSTTNYPLSNSSFQQATQPYTAVSVSDAVTATDEDNVNEPFNFEAVSDSNDQDSTTNYPLSNSSFQQATQPYTAASVSDVVTATDEDNVNEPFNFEAESSLDRYHLGVNFIPACAKEDISACFDELTRLAIPSVIVYQGTNPIALSKALAKPRLTAKAKCEISDRAVYFRPESLEDIPNFLASIKDFQLPKTQSICMRIRAEDIFQQLLNHYAANGEHQEIYNLRQMQSSTASLWIHAIPLYNDYRLSISRKEYITSNHLRLSLPPPLSLTSNLHPNVCACGVELYGTKTDCLHFLSGACVAARKTTQNTRHDAIGTTLKASFEEIGCLANLEPPLANSQKRADLNLIHPAVHSRGDSTSLSSMTDVTVVQLSPSDKARKAKTAAEITLKQITAQLRYRETSKNTKYTHLTKEMGVDFTPFVISTHGMILPASEDWMKNIAKSIAESSGTNSDFNPTAWFYRTMMYVSVTLQRHNARAIINSLQFAKRNDTVYSTSLVGGHRVQKRMTVHKKRKTTVALSKKAASSKKKKKN